MNIDVHVGLIRARIETLSDPTERSELTKVADDLASILRLVAAAERAPKTMQRYGIGPKHLTNAKWVRDRLNDELTKRLQRAESAKESA